jgi:hypothetical protein
MAATGARTAGSPLPLKPFVKKVVTGQDRRIAAPHDAYRSETHWYDIQYQY